MHMRLITLSFACLALIAAALWGWRDRAEPVERVDDTTVRELRELKTQVASLRDRLASAESANAATRTQMVKVRTTSEPSEKQPSPRVNDIPAVGPTREQQTAKFEEYFSNLDAIREQRDDPALTSAYLTALSDLNPELAALRKAKIDLVQCGNKLCRVELTFRDAAELRLGRTELMEQIGPLSGGASIHLDADRPHLTAYFAQRGSALPAFPSISE